MNYTTAQLAAFAAVRRIQGLLLKNADAEGHEAALSEIEDLFRLLTPALADGEKQDSPNVAAARQLRDQFAAAALQGLLANSTTSGSNAEFAKEAFNYALAMMAERDGL